MPSTTVERNASVRNRILFILSRCLAMIALLLGLIIIIVLLPLGMFVDNDCLDNIQNYASIGFAATAFLTFVLGALHHKHAKDNHEGHCELTKKYDI